MNKLSITNLQSGGLITNYYCSSKCRHCLYGCSPSWKKEYITSETARKNFEKVIELGCYTLHIGGGEPFLNTNGLLETTKTAFEQNLNIEYIETNSSWYKDEKSALEILNQLKKNRVNTLLISMSPFHNEHIPFKKVKNVIEACEKTGLSVFPWIHDFYKELNAFDDNVTHTLEEYKEQFGENYVEYIPSRYWIHFGGRAIETYKNIYDLKPIDRMLNDSKVCNELTDTSHFHVDLFGNYIPGLCSGLSIKVSDLGNSLENEKYPILTTLYNNGIKGFLELAKSKYGFNPKTEYLSKCHLCLEIRSFLIKERKVNSIELQPLEFYDNL